ncbi:hypothetical protein [uncultured Desulfovibrio sp.]|uniref:hypothetical protein n=1 Tax=uncultured Desulfovibrio sp. TaxID=167968 RepID=UPI002608CF94|nr:hypothetical protein [uncultured Desulfovibrio sp.]
MATIIIPTFGGEVPRTTPRLLEQTQAQAAVNCDLSRGALEPLRGPAKVADLAASARTIFKHDADGWLFWPSVVSVVKSAVLDIDGEAPLGHLLIPGVRPYPAQYRSAGIVCRLRLPPPATAPIVRIGGEAVLKTVRVYGFGADDSSGLPPRYGHEDGLPPLESSETAYVSAIGGASDTLFGDEESGIDSGISRSSSYCYTFVRILAGGIIQQESAPSPASAVIDVPDGDGVTVYGFEAPDLEDLGVTHIRIYRTASGEETSEFQFLVELEWPVDSYVDTKHDKDLSGDVLATTTWDAIPDDAQGIIKADNGIYAAFRGNELLLSEPFHPYAFPEAYRLTMEDAIVALAHTDNTIIVLTEGRPYLATGTAPESLQITHLPIEQSCMSARSVAMLAGGVIYACPDGLMLFSASDQSLITSDTWTREQWQSLNPGSILATVHDGRYVAFFEGTNQGFLFSIGAKDVVRVELPDGWQVRDVYHHSRDDCVYLSVDTPDGSAIFQCEAGEPLAYRWRSKLFFSSVLTCMSAARVEAQFRPRGSVKVAVFGPNQGRARMRCTVRDPRTKRLTTTRSEKVWSIEVSGLTPVFEIRMGGGVEEVERGGQ